jgi:hypothetical protein
VHSGIRAAATHNSHIHARKEGKNTLQLLLNCNPIWLSLPTVIGISIKRQFNENAHDLQIKKL